VCFSAAEARPRAGAWGSVRTTYVVNAGCLFFKAAFERMKLGAVWYPSMVDRHGRTLVNVIQIMISVIASSLGRRLENMRRRF